MIRFKSVLSALSVMALVAMVGAEETRPTEEGKKQEKTTYVDHIRPLLRSRCGSCHNANDRRGSLVVDNYAALMEGGSSGTVVEPGDIESSYLWSLVSHDAEPFMPPNSDRLPDEELALIRKWIEGGALENSGSVANIQKKPSLAKVDVTGSRPANVAYPETYLGEPVVSPSGRNSVTALATSPWAPLAAVSGHHQVALYNSHTLQPLGVLAFPEGQPEVLKFSRTGDLVLVGGGRGGASGRVVVFDVRTGERKIEVGEEYDSVLAADISPDHTKVALGGPKRMLRVYSTETGELLYEVKKHTDWVTAIEFSPDGVLLASADRSNGLFVWETHTGNLFYDLQGHRGPITDVSWRPDSNVLASSSEDGTIKLWEMQNGSSLKSWNAHGGGVAAVDYTRDGRLVSTGRDRKAVLWTGDGGKEKEFGGLADIGMEAAFDAESNRVLAGDWTGMVYLWNATDGNLAGTIDTNPPSLEQQLASLQNELKSAQAEAQKRAETLQRLKNELQAKQKAAQSAQQAAQQAQQQAEQAAQMNKQRQSALKEKQASVEQAQQVLQKAEQALAAAKAAFEAAQKEQQASQQAFEAARAAALQAAQAEQAAVQAAEKAKSAAEKAAAQASLTEEQSKALREAEAAAEQAQQRLKQLEKQIEQLQAARDSLAKSGK